MGPPPQKAPGTHTETRYYIDPQGQVHQKQVQVPDRQAVPEPHQEYQYFKRPDGTVVRQRMAPVNQAAPRPPPTQPATHTPPPQPTNIPGQSHQPPRRAIQPQQRPTSPQYGEPVHQRAPVQEVPPPPSMSRAPGVRRPPRWTLKRVAKHVFVIAVILLLLLWPTTIPNMRALVNTIITGEPAFQPFPEEAQIKLERVLTLSAPISIDWEIQLSEPYDIPGIHELKDLTTSPNPTRSYVYKDQNWMEWSGTTPRTGGTVQLQLVYDMHLYSTLWDIDPSDSANVADIPSEYDKYLGTEWKITPDDPQVQTLSAEIVNGETNVYKILLDIYNWMDDNLEYNTQRDPEPKSCSQTLSSGKGDCDDQSILLASLARAAGVPVWLNLGIIYDPVRNYWGGHGWNNVFIPLKNGNHVIATVDIVNNQFLFRDPYHISDYIDNSDGDDLKDYYTSWSYSYNTGTGPPNVDSEETYSILDLKTTGSVVYTAP